ncbi:sodium- and chloride-dependent glycine transporter 1, partial [Drosophila novamexicana]|uniref:sodium- and chloride-dependent glycine transporter 1 n=1 Tax=Drosophila novamexicana TaxID=47314 RepID=UPI0011E58DA7
LGQPSQSLQQNEDRFTSCEFNVEHKVHKLPHNNKKATAAGTLGAATAGGGGAVVCPAISIAGCASGTALVTLDALDAVTIETAEPERGNWTGRFDFLLSLLGYSVGLGNVWRFPYLCYNNGGGAFLIPFTIMLIIAGLPLMFMELSFGQYAALGPVAIYRRFCPLFRGLGTGMVIVSAIVMLYYNLIIAWTIFYMFASFRTQLPWQNCEPEWSTENCFSYVMADQCEAINGTYYLRTCYNATYAEDHNITELALHALKRPPAEEYFNNYVLGLSSGIEETGSIKFSLAACLLIAWVIVFLCLCKGVQSSGKVVYFTALFPYLVLVILFFRGVTLPGASTGILFYLTPDWKQLANAQVWGDAAVQIFFALSPAWGGLITLSSYNKFSNNCYKDSLIVAFCNIATSFFAGLVIFSIIGFLAHELDVEVKKVVDQGAGLAFIVYPEVVTRLPISPVWSVLFFVMLLTLGLDSQFALMETVTTAILDKFPNLRQYKTWVVLFVGIFGYVGGLGFTTNSGMYWLQLMDKYAANWSVLLIAISECVLIAWIYGSQRFLNDIQGMIGKRSRLWNFFWGFMWRYITPATLLFILFFNWVEYKPAQYGHYIYPLWADTVGWIVGLLPVFIIFVIGVQQIFKAPKHLSFRERIKVLMRPTAEWGPAGRPCVNLHAERYQSQNYDGVTNTQILISGAPTDVMPYEDALPGPSILKTSAKLSGNSNQQQAQPENGRHKPKPESSSSQQPPIKADNQNQQHASTPATATVAATTKVLSTGTMSSGRECNTMSTFTATAAEPTVGTGGAGAGVAAELAMPKTTAAAVAGSQAKIATTSSNIAAVPAGTKPDIALTTFMPATKPMTTAVAQANTSKTAATDVHMSAVSTTAINGKVAATAIAAANPKSQTVSTMSVSTKAQPNICVGNKTAKTATTVAALTAATSITATNKSPMSNIKACNNTNSHSKAHSNIADKKAHNILFNTSIFQDTSKQTNNNNKQQHVAKDNQSSNKQANSHN